MSSSSDPYVPTPLDLEAYSDDELPQRDREQVRVWLERHPDAARDLHRMEEREALLRQAARAALKGEGKTGCSRVRSRRILHVAGWLIGAVLALVTAGLVLAL